MPALSLVPGTIRRSRGDLPRLPLVNMFPEEAITEPTQFALQSRPGLDRTDVLLGEGPVRKLYRADGVVGGQIVAISGSSMYVGANEAGELTGGGDPSVAGNEIGVIATAGENVSFYDGETYRAVAFPDDALVTAVAEQGGRFIFLRAGTHHYYWTKPLANMLDENGDIVIDGLDYASAESEPDKLVDIVVWESHLILAGVDTIEFHGPTGDDDAPWAPTIGRVFTKGVRDTGCITLWDSTFAWVSPGNIVYQNGGAVPLPISDAGVQEIISASQTCLADSYFFEGHEFLRIRLDNTDLLFDAQTREWSEQRTYGRDGFLGGSAINIPGSDSPLFGSKDDGYLLVFSGDSDLGAEVERMFRCGLVVIGDAIRINNVSLRTNPGQTGYVVGTFANPIVELRHTRDGGQTWSEWRQTGLGEQGAYRKSVQWRALGMFDAPGALFEIRVTDPVPFRVSGAYYNERLTGRSRWPGARGGGVGPGSDDTYISDPDDTTTILTDPDIDDVLLTDPGGV